MPVSLCFLIDDRTNPTGQQGLSRQAVHLRSFPWTTTITRIASPIVGCIQKH